MTKKKALWLMAGGLLLVGVSYGIYRLIQAGKKPLEEGEDPAEKAGFCKYSGFPLRHGSCGKEVGELQMRLNARIRPPHALLKVDEKFGDKTEAMLKYYLGKTQITEQDLFNEKLMGRGIALPMY